MRLTYILTALLHYLHIQNCWTLQPHEPKLELKPVNVSNESEVSILFEELWDWLVETNPEASTWIGFTKFNGNLKNLSLQSILNEYNMTHQFYERATELHKQSSDPYEKDNLSAMMHWLKIFNDGKAYQGYLLPLNNMNGVHLNLQKLFDRMPNKTITDIFNMIERLKKFPLQINETMELMKKGLEEGIVNHNVSTNKINGIIDEFIVANPEDSPSFKYFMRDWLPKDSNPIDIQGAAKQAIRVVSDSLQVLRDFINTNYTTRQDISVTSMTNGKEFYNACVRFYVPGMKIQEIHDIGIKEVQRIIQLMMTIIAEMGHEGKSIKEFSDLIKSDGNNYYNTSEELTAACEHLIHDRIQPKLLNYFSKFPKSRVKVKGESNPSVGAYYRISSYDGTIPGQFIIGTSNLKLWPKYSLPSLTLHEANPGHHFQISLKNEDETMPMFRKYAGSFSNFATVPSTFPWYSSFIEGWGLYSEYLGLEMGVYETPLEKFGHYSLELIRAIRLVVDTGMHALGWTREQAIAYMEERLPYDRTFIEIEIDRHITWPGQALSYKLGQLKILDWRKDAERSLGGRMNIKEFHAVILTNPTDLLSVKKKVKTWIKEKKNHITEQQ